MPRLTARQTANAIGTRSMIRIASQSAFSILLIPSFPRTPHHISGCFHVIHGAAMLSQRSIPRRELVCPWVGCDKTFSQKSNFEDHYKTQYVSYSLIHLVGALLLTYYAMQHATSPHPEPLPILQSMPLPLGDPLRTFETQEGVTRQERGQGCSID